MLKLMNLHWILQLLLIDNLYYITHKHLHFSKNLNHIKHHNINFNLVSFIKYNLENYDDIFIYIFIHLPILIKINNYLILITLILNIYQHQNIVNFNNFILINEIDHKNHHNLYNINYSAYTKFWDYYYNTF